MSPEKVMPGTIFQQYPLICTNSKTAP